MQQFKDVLSFKSQFINWTPKKPLQVLGLTHRYCTCGITWGVDGDTRSEEEEKWYEGNWVWRWVEGEVPPTLIFWKS